MYFEKINTELTNTSAIIIFLGWGMDSRPFADLHKDGYDIILAWGIPDNNSKSRYDELISQYDNVVVIAWSYGVAVADKFISEAEALRIAVNGTVTPVDNETGIPKHIFAITLRSVSETNMRRFYLSVSGISKLRKHFMSHLPQRSIESLKEDLEAYSHIRSDKPNRMWDKAYIADNDAIIPPANQCKAWEGFEVVHTSESHLPDFQHIIDTEILNKKIIARSFTRSLSSYDGEAIVQKKIADTLYDYWTQYQSLKDVDILEVGVGTGFLTNKYASDKEISHITLVDIASKDDIQKIANKQQLCDKTTVISADAEQYLAALPDESFDTVLSSSTIQWFESPKRFFVNVARILRKGGVAAISTFENGNYQEITEMTGRSLNYRSLEQYEAMLPQSLKIEFTMRDKEICEFSDGKSLLKHIKNTGVNALNVMPLSFSQISELIKKLDKSPRLTYRYIYLIVRKI